MSGLRLITQIVVHCSATPNGRPVSAAEIDRWHGERGFQRSAAWIERHSPALHHIGYHAVIGIDGTLTPGRHVNEIGAHVAGSNAHSIGICMVGLDSFTREQWRTLYRLVASLRVEYPTAEVLGHRDCSPDLDGDGKVEPWEWLKTCPGFDVADWLESGPAAEHVLQTVNGHDPER